MEKLTINKLAELGFRFVSDHVMSNGDKLINTYSLPYTIDGKPVLTVDDLQLTQEKPTKRANKG